MSPSPNRLTIDLSALVYNLDQVKNLINPGIRIMGIVKSEAYGHGLLRVSKLLEENGVHSLGVAHIHEARQLRDNGIRLPIVVLCGITSRADSQEVVDRSLTPVVYDLSSAERLSQEASRQKKDAKIH